MKVKGNIDLHITSHLQKPGGTLELQQKQSGSIGSGWTFPIEL